MDTVIRPQEQSRPAVGSWRFDWAIVGLSFWFLGGLFLDGWAHTHNRVDNSFFTSWHAVLYAGFLAIASVLTGVFLRNLARGCAWRTALPMGYGLSLLGTVIFWCGGVGDLLWHTMLGFEKGVALLFSPPHLLLGCGAWFVVSGPFRAAWHGADLSTPGQRHLWPAVLALTFMLCIGTFLTQVAHPIANLWGSGMPREPLWLFEQMGVIGLLFDTALLMGFVLLALQRWTLPAGALTVMLTVNALAMSVLYYHGYPPPLHLVARGMAGLVADLLLVWLRPSRQRVHALRLFAFTMPVVTLTSYFVTIHYTAGIWWSVHLWSGVIFLSGIVGLLLSYVLVPPPVAEEG